MGMASLTGGGGLSSSSSATSGDAEGLSGSGNKVFNFGVNPANASATQSITDLLGNPVVLITLAVVTVAWLKKGRRRGRRR